MRLPQLGMGCLVLFDVHGSRGLCSPALHNRCGTPSMPMHAQLHVLVQSSGRPCQVRCELWNKEEVRALERGLAGVHIDAGGFVAMSHRRAYLPHLCIPLTIVAHAASMPPRRTHKYAHSCKPVQNPACLSLRCCRERV